VRIVGIDVPGFGVPTHAEAKDVLAGAMLNYARAEIEAGPVAAPAQGRSDRPTVPLLGEMFPADPMMIGAMLAPMGLAVGPVVPCREWRELYAALDAAVCAAIHPFYTASMREFEAAGRPIVGSAPVGYDGTAAWLASATPWHVAPERVAAAQNAFLPAIRAALARPPSRARSRCRATRGRSSGRAPADRERGRGALCRHGLPAHRSWSRADREWLEAKGVTVKYRASLEDDCAAMEAIRPDLAIGTTPVVQKGKELGIPASTSPT
jgi:3,8-divinyl chlorophyllide a/chlorophyllide a reductase subunit Y